MLVLFLKWFNIAKYIFLAINWEKYIFLIFWNVKIMFLIVILLLGKSKILKLNTNICVKGIFWLNVILLLSWFDLAKQSCVQ